MLDVVEIVQKVAANKAEGVCWVTNTSSGITVYTQGPENQPHLLLVVRVSANTEGLNIIAPWGSFPQVKIDWNKNPEAAVEKALDNLMNAVYKEAVKRRLD